MTPRMVVVIAVACAWGCGGTSEPGGSVSGDETPAATARTASPTTRADLPPVTLPDLSEVAAPVARQIRSGFDELSRAIEAPAAADAARAQAYGAYGHVMMAAAVFETAATCYRYAERLTPNDARWPYYLGHALLRHGDRVGATGAFEHAIALQPRNEPALVWLADIYLDEERLDEAQSTYARALSINPDSASALFGAGRVALARQAYADAVRHLEHALALAPRASAIHYPLAMAHRALGHRETADGHFARRGPVGPALPDPLMQEAEITLDSAVSHEKRGVDALQRQDWAAAVAAFRQGLVADPRDPSLRYWLGTALYVSGDQPGAEREFRTVLRADPGFARAHFSLGALLAARGDHTQALAAYADAVRTAPTLPEARVRLAETLRALNRRQEAMTQYEEAVRIDPGQVDAWNGGARVLMELRDTARARTWVAQARQVHPERRELSELEAQLR